MGGKKAFGGQPIHLLDFEGNRECGIVEFGIATLCDSEIVEVSTKLCQGSAPISLEDSRIHGIRDGDLVGTKPFSEEWDDFVRFRRSGPLGAHHAVYENNLLKYTWSHPPFCPDFINLGGEIAEWGPWVDTRVLYQRLFPTLEDHKLENLVRRFGLQGKLNDLAVKFCPEERRRYHCALYDALAAAVLLQNISTFSGYEGVTVAWLLLNSATGAKDNLNQLDLFDV